MRWLIAVMLAVSMAAPSQAATVTFRSTVADFHNPERGFWRQPNGDFLAATPDELDDTARYGTLAHAMVRLDDYRHADLPPSLLDRLAGQMALARTKGLKLILRFAYNDGLTDSVGLDAPLAQVLRHIAALKPVVAANADVVFVWQMGFIGAWGEGHTSSNHLTSRAAEKRIGDALLDALPAGRQLQWRTPAQISLWYPTVAAIPAAPRIGLFNDCFLASTTDWGTYADDASQRAAQKHYVARLTAAAPFGGETCFFDASTVGARTSCADLLSEGRRFHLSYLGRDWYQGFIDAWRAGGCLDDVSRSMGYRLQLSAASAPVRVARGGTATVRLSLRNVGWAAPVNRRPLLLRLRDSSGQLVTTVTGADLRTLGPGTSRSFGFALTVPSTLAVGRYQLWAAAPDVDARLAGNPAYAIRFANAARSVGGLRQAWNGKTGEFSLGLALDVR